MKERTRDTIFMLVTIGAAALVMWLIFALVPQAAQGADPTITVDGVTYPATKTSGPTIHFETPDSNPTVAFTERNVWEGNGSDNLPCEGGIHWIDNQNLLTVSHCLEGETTTTTTVPEVTTTTIPEETTTSSVVESTTTSVTSTTSSVPEQTTTTTDSPSTTVAPATSVPSTPSLNESELPYTGTGTDLLALLGAILSISGLSVVAWSRRNAA